MIKNDKICYFFVGHVTFKLIYLRLCVVKYSLYLSKPAKIQNFGSQGVDIKEMHEVNRLYFPKTL